MTAAIKNTYTNIVDLYTSLNKLEGKAEGIGREIVLDIFNNAATYNLPLLALGNSSLINTEARKQWMEKTFPEYKAASDIQVEHKNNPMKKGASIEERRAREADVEAVKVITERYRAATNRAVACAFYMHSRNAENIHFVGSKKNKILFNFIGDVVDTFTTAPVLVDGKVVPVSREPRSYITGILETNGNLAIAAHIAKKVSTNPTAVKQAPQRKKPAAKQVEAQTKEVLSAPAVIASAEGIAEYFNNTSGDALITAATSTQAEKMLCGIVRARFGKFDATKKVLRSIDIGEVFNWLRTQAEFKEVQWTGHASTAEVISIPRKEVLTPAQATKVMVAKRTSTAKK